MFVFISQFSRWKGSFQAKFIEEITHRTGNFKPYNVFLKMLVSAFDGDSNSVSLDLLSSEDLEALRQASGLGSRSPGSSSNPKSKRYLILTYQGEFDKVHYPMALPYCDVDDTVELKRTIVRLRDELDELRKSQIDIKSLRELEMLVLTYKSEKEKMTKDLNDCMIEKSRLQTEMESLRSENHLLRTRGEVLESQLHNSWIGKPRLADTGRSRTSSLALSPANSLRRSPQRHQQPGSRASSPVRRLTSPRRPPLASSPYQQSVQRKRQSQRAVSPQKSLVSPKSTRLPISPRQVVASVEPVALSEVDARLQALQNFLKHQKAGR